MKIIEEIKNNQLNIWLEICNAIHDCDRITKKNCKTKPPQEPDYVAVLAKSFGPRLAKILKRYTNGLTITVNSIFCHQSPKITTRYGTTEIGDILFVLYNKCKNERITLNSLLLQAKIGNKNISSTDAQLRLYTEWPSLTYNSPKSLLTRIKKENPTCKGGRDVLPKTLNTGAKYMLINSTNDFMNTAVANEHLTADLPLSIEIIQFLTFSSGKTFENDKTGTNRDDWTNVMWDLIKQAEITQFNRTRSGFNNQFRGNIQDIGTVQNKSDESSFFFNFKDNYNEEWQEEEEEEQCVSVIAIEISEKTD